ncbi:MAG TPA: proton-conducting transporter membrane subunit, partial [Candidatus Acidoferrum sp.]|nr:proton-conducting transporter membrane subunit [Candidatus Acidoferrum sp.]
IVAHTFMIIGAFSIVFWLEQRNISTMDEYSGLAGRNMFAAVALSILMLSMAGIPPLIGFAGKFLLFSSALGANDPMLAFLGIINSFISIFYYAKVINQMFLRKEEKSIAMDRNIAIAVGICLIVVIFVGIYPQVLLGAASAAASALGV